MRVAVLGLWHLGSVTAACIAAAGHQVTGWDPDRDTIAKLAIGTPPVAEPGLGDLLSEQLQAERLRFTHAVDDALRSAQIVWVTFDTPVDADDHADIDFVMRQVREAFLYLPDGAVVLISSQMPVGTVRRLEREWASHMQGRRVSFATSPENLRLGRAIEVFTRPDRVVIGVRSAEDRERLTELFAPIPSAIEWMSVEAAEMTKHAINAFLGMSVAFINEVAALCERVGADAKEVERGLRTEQRIGPRAYLSPGGAFAGGTLARDVMFLREIGRAQARPTPLLDGVEASNTNHRAWAQRRLEQELGALDGHRIALWGLTYKPGTDTLRRSGAIELCRWLAAAGASVRVHDPAAADLPPDLSVVERLDDAVRAAMSADALVVTTEWPVYRTIDVDRLAAVMPSGLVLDANRFLGPVLASDARFRLVSVGQPSRTEAAL
jgi:UDPglucose 6-dehydrogenase